MELPQLKRLAITGPISVEPVTTRIPHDPQPYLHLIMGPTGAGKSSFIEALSGESQELMISKDQLAGFTQTINTYRLVNVESTEWKTSYGPHQVYLVDTPGFSDSKISEIEIVDMIKTWLKYNDFEFVQKILFLTPITETRLPGSRRRTIETFRHLLSANYDLGAMLFVTTMWDTLHNERTRTRAESNFAQLRDDICKDFFEGRRVSINRFTNTRSSALEVLDFTSLHGADTFSKPVSSISPNLYRDLHERTEGALQSKKIIESDLAQPDAQTNVELRAILKKNQRDNHDTLTKFIAQLINFGPPPPGYHRAAQHLRKSVAVQFTPEDPLLVNTFRQWAQEPEILEEPVPHSDPSLSQAPKALPRPSTSEELALKGLVRRLLNVSRDRGSKWFKERA